MGIKQEVKEKQPPPHLILRHFTVIDVKFITFDCFFFILMVYAKNARTFHSIHHSFHLFCDITIGAQPGLIPPCFPGLAGGYKQRAKHAASLEGNLLSLSLVAVNFHQNT